MPDKRWNKIIQLVLLASCALAFKYVYSASSVNDLRWILGPTTAVVETVTGSDFHFESHAGYLKDDRTFLIAASCSGVNFLVTAFLLLSIAGIWRNRSRWLGWRNMILYALTAYLATVAANAVRITTAIQMHRPDIERGWFDPGRMHRLEGILIYFGFLLLLFFFGEWIDNRLNGNGNSNTYWSEKAGLQSRGGKGKVSARLLYYLLPLAVYYSMTLAVPLANGAYRQGSEFWEHALFVLAAPLLLLAPIALVWVIAGRPRFGKKCG